MKNGTKFHDIAILLLMLVYGFSIELVARELIAQTPLSAQPASGIVRTKSLDLSKQKIKPQTITLISKFINLEHLNLAETKINELPEPELERLFTIIGQLQRLQSLNLYGNLLGFFPDEIAALKKLKNLNLGYNNIPSESLGSVEFSS